LGDNEKKIDIGTVKDARLGSLKKHIYKETTRDGDTVIDLLSDTEEG